MKKSVAIVLAAVLAFGGAAGSAYAKKGKNEEKGKGKQAAEEARGKGKGSEKSEESKLKIKLEYKGKTNSVTEDTYESEFEFEYEYESEESGKEQGKVKGKGKGPNGFKGLSTALQNVKDKPSGAVLANLLLTHYGAQLSDELKAELEAIVEADVALAAVAEALEQEGSVTEAVYVQKEAIRANKRELNHYKKLGKMYEKAGKHGVKLYVNGEEPVFGAAPFIKDGSTLVPFRAIAEALEAEVSWNAQERSVTVSRDGITVKLLIGSTTAYVNGQEVTLQVPGEIVNGTTVVPVRFISESLKADVQWEPETQSVVINEEAGVTEETVE